MYVCMYVCTYVRMHVYVLKLVNVGRTGVRRSTTYFPCVTFIVGMNHVKRISDETQYL